MNYCTLYVWVEGLDDSRFFKGIFKPFFKEQYYRVKVIEYASKSRKSIASFLKSIVSAGDSYLFFGDFDAGICVTDTKKSLVATYDNLDDQRTIVVKKEIESWYLVGLDSKNSKYLKITNFKDTEDVTKEDFLRSKKDTRFSSKIDLMSEIIKRYSIDEARQKNSSFAYFYKKFCSATALSKS